MTLLILIQFDSRASVSKGNTIEIKSEFGKIVCPSGAEINMPLGSKLEVSEHKFGDNPIVRVPKRLSKKCSYGILKYSSNSRAGESRKQLKKEAKKAAKYSLVAEKMNYADKCKDEFIGTDGMGDWGKYVKKELKTKTYKSLLRNSKTFENVCPGYSFMQLEDRKNLWVFILMSMSHYESSCRPQVEAQGPNGVAKGLFQLHENAENKYAQWDLSRICKKGGASNPKASLQCTLSMLNGQIEKYNSLFFQKSYWDVLRNVNDPETHAFKIKNAIGMLKGCEVRTLASSKESLNPIQNRKKL